MKLYELQKVTQSDYDCYDIDFDYSVTMCYIDNAEDDYDRFCMELAKKVDVIRAFDNSATCDWTTLILDNLGTFKTFTKEHWTRDFNNTEDFICEWIKELHSYVAGNVPDEFYKVLNEFVSTLK